MGGRSFIHPNSNPLVLGVLFRPRSRLFLPPPTAMTMHNPRKGENVILPHEPRFGVNLTDPESEVASPTP
jgi:hypothetical protein